ncbi:S24 family peptidase [Novosphingobium gossypii]|uniref:S24 family peptidase n=1 Tax=Novosphingobium gossypii TaxID=1604774 RepID=UPI003D2486C7
MSEQADRLNQAIQETGLTKKELSERYGWSYDTLKSNANGSMRFSYKKALVYAHRLKVRAEWLFEGTPPMRPEPMTDQRQVSEVPLVGWVQAGQLGDITVMHDLGEVETAITDNLGPGDWFATTVKGDSMDRVSPEGSRIFVNAAERTPVNGGFYLFSRRGETTYKRYYDDPVQRLEPFSTNPINKTIFINKKENWIVVGRVHRSVYDLI